MGRAKHRQCESKQAGLSPQSDPAPSKRSKLLIQGVLALVIVGVVVLLLVQGIADRKLDHDRVGTSGAPAAVPDASLKPTIDPEDELKPGTLDELLALPVDQLDRVDIGRMNLLCASAMPGGEYLTPEGIDHALSVIDSWLPRIESETRRHLYRASDPRYFDEYGGSEAKVRAAMLAIVLQEDLGVKYDPSADGNFSFAKTSVAFIHGMIPQEGQTLSDTPGGTCVSMPVLYVAVGRRLGYPLKLSTTDSHIFVRWEGADHPNPRLRGRFNIEATDGVGFPEDEHYMVWPNKITERQVRVNGFLMSLSPAEEFAQFLAARGHVGFDNGAVRFAARCYENAYRYDTTRPAFRSWFVDAAMRSNYQPTTALLAQELVSRRQMAMSRAQTDEPSPQGHAPWRTDPKELLGVAPTGSHAVAGYPNQAVFGQQQHPPQNHHSIQSNHQPHAPAAYHNTFHTSGYPTHPSNGE